MEQPIDVLSVTSEEARFEVRFEYSSDLLKQWQRHPVRTSRKVVKYVRPILGVLLILVGVWNLWIKGQVLADFLSEFGVPFSLQYYFSYWGAELLIPILAIVVGVLEFFVDRIRLNRNLKQMAAVYGPEPWPIRYLFGEEAFTNSFSGSSQTMPYARVRKVEDAGDFLLLWVGKLIFRLPKSAMAKGAWEELQAFLQEKIPSRT